MKKYIKWVFTDHYFKRKRNIFKLVGTLYGIIQAIYATPIIWDEWYYGHIPLWPLIGSFIAIYGFLIGITLQPVSIYLRLKRLGRLD
jgi:hypothetical protein